MFVPPPTTSRREWCWLIAVQTAVAVTVLSVVHTLAPAWISAVAAALSTWVIAGAAGAAVLHRRKRQR